MQQTAKPEPFRAIALGFFDGVHIGHQALLARLREQSGLLQAVFTFYNHPASFFAPDKEPFFLSTPREKEALLRQYGAQEVFMPVFDGHMANLSPEEFIEYLLEELRARVIVTGENYRFAKSAQGDAALLARLAARKGAAVYAIENVLYRGEIVSSTRVRGLLKAGRIEDVNAMLARTYTLTGEVGKGRRIGTTLGIPTANVCYPAGKALPADGVYAGYAAAGEASYPAVINIGLNPTVNGTARTVEAHLIGFGGDLYGKQISVGFTARLRDEIRFPSQEALRRQVLRDMEAAAERNILG